ncbi:hypothetical protein ABT317_36145, partial [Streptomyces carpinensis]
MTPMTAVTSRLDEVAGGRAGDGDDDLDPLRRGRRGAGRGAPRRTPCESARTRAQQRLGERRQR